MTTSNECYLDPFQWPPGSRTIPAEDIARVDMFMADHKVELGKPKCKSKWIEKLLMQGGHTRKSVGPLAHDLWVGEYRPFDDFLYHCWKGEFGSTPLILLGHTNSFGVDDREGMDADLTRRVRSVGLEVAVSPDGWYQRYPRLVTIFHPATLAEHYKWRGISPDRMKGRWWIPGDVTLSEADAFAVWRNRPEPVNLGTEPQS